MLIWDSIKNLFASKCGDCDHHSGGSTCHKIGGIVAKNNPKCGYFKPKKKKKSKGFFAKLLNKNRRKK